MDSSRPNHPETAQGAQRRSEAAPSEMSRREALKILMSASGALALGIAGCDRKPRRKIISRVDGPEYSQPAKILYYSSTWTGGAFPYGLAIKTVDGRPVKIEGNPDHPVNAGTSSAAMQASLLSLYDPDRLRGPVARNGKPVEWRAVDEQIAAAARGAKRVVLVTRSTLGPSERAIVARFLALCPSAEHFVHESIHDVPRRSAWAPIYGQDGEIVPRYDLARIVLSFDCDFLGDDGVVLESIRRFSDGRAVEKDLSRFYAIESAMTVTGANADTGCGFVLRRWLRRSTPCAPRCRAQ